MEVKNTSIPTPDMPLYLNKYLTSREMGLDLKKLWNSKPLDAFNSFWKKV